MREKSNTLAWRFPRVDIAIVRVNERLENTLADKVFDIAVSIWESQDTIIKILLAQSIPGGH